MLWRTPYPGCFPKWESRIRSYRSVSPSVNGPASTKQTDSILLSFLPLPPEVRIQMKGPSLGGPYARTGLVLGLGRKRFIPVALFFLGLSGIGTSFGGLHSPVRFFWFLTAYFDGLVSGTLDRPRGSYSSHDYRPSPQGRRIQFFQPDLPSLPYFIGPPPLIRLHVLAFDPPRGDAVFNGLLRLFSFSVFLVNPHPPHALFFSA